MDLFGKYKTDEDFIKSAKKYVDNFKNTDVILWGKGKTIPVLLEHCKDLNIKYIIDKNEKLEGSVFGELKIFTPKKLKSEDKKGLKIIVMLSGCDYVDIKNEIKSQTSMDEELLEQSVCSAYEYIIAQNIINKKKLVVPNLELIINTLCTLKCKHCIAKIPYFEKGNLKAKKFESLKREIDDIFEKFDFIGQFQLATGEVMLHNELAQILQYISSNYRSKYKDLTFVTNGTYIPDDKKLEAMSKYVDFVQISPYSHPHLEGKIKAEELMRRFDEYKINYFYSHYATGRDLEWNDIGDLDTARNRNIKDNINMYKNCLMNVCKCISKGNIYPCTAACYNTLRKSTAFASCDNDTDFVAITSSKLQIARFYLKAGSCDFPQICDYCDGIGSVVNSSYVRAGEQLQ